MAFQKDVFICYYCVGLWVCVWDVWSLHKHIYICVDRSDVVTGHLLELVFADVCEFRDRVRWSCSSSWYFHPLSLLVGQNKTEWCRSSFSTVPWRKQNCPILGWFALALSPSAAVMTCSVVMPSSLGCYLCVTGFPRQESGVPRCLFLCYFTVVSAAANCVFFPTLWAIVLFCSYHSYFPKVLTWLKKNPGKCIGLLFGLALE